VKSEKIDFGIESLYFLIKIKKSKNKEPTFLSAGVFVSSFMKIVNSLMFMKYLELAV
jgi:hypothetical protein